MREVFAAGLGNPALRQARMPAATELTRFRAAVACIWWKAPHFGRDIAAKRFEPRETRAT
jgi:hypothetical protein